jgi:hypothetical protein
MQKKEFYYLQLQFLGCSIVVSLIFLVFGISVVTYFGYVFLTPLIGDVPDFQLNYKSLFNAFIIGVIVCFVFYNVILKTIKDMG